MLPAAVAACGGEDPAASTKTTRALKFTSSLDGGHTHTFELDVDLLASPPPGGWTDATSSDGGHTHTVVLEMDQLAMIEAGSTVVVETTNDAMHTHTFTFAKAQGEAIKV